MLAASALALAACAGHPPPPAEPIAAQYPDRWFAASGGGALPLKSVNLHLTAYGWAGRATLADNRTAAIRDIAMTDGELSFTVPAIRSSFHSTTPGSGAWPGVWTADGANRAMTLSASAEPASEPTDDPYAQVHQIVALPDGRRMDLYCEGEGAPAVILEPGADGMMESWRAIQHPVSRSTRTCTYSRSGLQFSDPGPEPRDAARAAEDLAALLKAAGVPAPYVLVSHSLGSYIVRQYANTRFSDVAGLVLVDPSGDDQATRFAAASPGLWNVQDGLMRMQRACLAVLRSSPASAPAMNCSQRDATILATSLSEVEAMVGPDTPTIRSRRSWGDLPLIVLSRGVPPGNAASMTQLAKDESEAAERVWSAMHEEMAALSTSGRRRIVALAGHGIQRDQPQVVIDAILQVVQEARTRTAG
jgi:pimeloyl-ACP methyl ester carboxylesterase